MMHSRQNRHAVTGLLWAALVAVFLFWPSRTFAQAARSIGANSKADITFRGTVSSAVEIFVRGSTDLKTGTTTNVLGSGTAGTVNFGVYNLASALLTGDKHRVNSAPAGTYLVATLTVGVRFSGAFTGAAAELQRTNPTGAAPDVPQTNLLYAFQGPKNGKAKNGKLIWPDWKKFPEVRFGTNVFEVPAAGTGTGTGNLDAALASGDTLDHQIAVWVPDSAPAGAFSTIVTYSATAF